jgi:hypothetical protein
MSTDREVSAAAKEFTPFLPRLLSTQTIDFCTSLKDVLVVHLMKLRVNQSILGMRLRRELLPLGFWIASNVAYPCRDGVVTPWRAGQLFHDDLGLSR